MPSTDLDGKLLTRGANSPGWKLGTGVPSTSPAREFLSSFSSRIKLLEQRDYRQAERSLLGFPDWESFRESSIGVIRAIKWSSPALCVCVCARTYCGFLWDTSEGNMFPGTSLYGHIDFSVFVRGNEMGGEPLVFPISSRDNERAAANSEPGTPQSFLQLL